MSRPQLVVHEIILYRPELEGCQLLITYRSIHSDSVILKEDIAKEDFTVTNLINSNQISQYYFRTK